MPRCHATLLRVLAVGLVIAACQPIPEVLGLWTGTASLHRIHAHLLQQGQSRGVTFALFRVRPGGGETVSARWCTKSAPRTRAFPLCTPLAASGCHTSPSGALNAHQRHPGLAGLFELTCENTTYPSLDHQECQPGDGFRLAGKAAPHGLIMLPHTRGCHTQKAADINPWRQLVEDHVDPPPGPDEIVAALILSWEDGRGRLYEIPLMRVDSESEDALSVLRHRLGKCVLTATATERQPLFPPAEVLSRAPLRGAIADFRVISGTIRSAVYVRHGVSPLESRSDASISTIPPMPNYCGMDNGTLDAGTVRQLKEQHEISFIETHVESLEFPIPFVEDILKFCMELAMPALINPMAEEYVKQSTSRMSDEMQHKVVAQVPEDVSKLLGPPLSFNVSNLAEDALTASVSKALISAITLDLGAPITNKIAKPILDAIYEKLDPFLRKSVPRKITAVVPVSKQHTPHYLFRPNLPHPNATATTTASTATIATLHLSLFITTSTTGEFLRFGSSAAKLSTRHCLTLHFPASHRHSAITTLTSTQSTTPSITQMRWYRWIKPCTRQRPRSLQRRRMMGRLLKTVVGSLLTLLIEW